MFICIERCADKYGIPSYMQFFMLSRGRCEECGQTGNCVDWHEGPRQPQRGDKPRRR